MKLSPVLRSCCAVLLLTPGTAFAAAVPATPTTALFYPNEVLLTVEEHRKPEIIPGNGPGLKIVLPSGAQQATFSATVNDTPAGSFYWLEVPPSPP
ncbi:MAG: hypothetical protein LIP28_08875, partial [Deltaproteobacteria bacterium]|nr:hypothetical protein [Deltaproteobacteria bacterium]